MSARQSTFALPLLIGLLSAAGLFSALLGDGAWDAVAWLGLGSRGQSPSIAGMPRRRQ